MNLLVIKEVRKEKVDLTEILYFVLFLVFPHSHRVEMEKLLLSCT